MSKMLNHEERELFIEVLQKRKPELTILIRKVGIIPLTTFQREELREAVAAELSESGLNKDDEPNSRGLLLEALIDKLTYL